MRQPQKGCLNRSRLGLVMRQAFERISRNEGENICVSRLYDKAPGSNFDKPKISGGFFTDRNLKPNSNTTSNVFGLCNYISAVSEER